MMTTSLSACTFWWTERVEREKHWHAMPWSICQRSQPHFVPACSQVDKSFQGFKDLLLMHSVQRPPYSTGLFTLAEVKTIMNWMLDTYYRHYKLYMYTFTDRVLMSVTQTHPMDIVETMAQAPMQVR